MIVAITGGTGFIGKKLVARLVERGDNVRLLTRNPPGSGLSYLVKIHQCDLLSVSVNELSAMLDGVDVLYHCAGNLTNTQAMQALHVDVTRKLVDAASGRVGMRAALWQGRSGGAASAAWIGSGMRPRCSGCNWIWVARLQCRHCC